ncbi:hypothetical protein MNBD_GAMMA25-998 [hydrothermal vent metagenome]|uniref:SbsA Ig-like domain-containing protein n=1 Tax=hydrothermal vent metagenome TaxID=652676 RepID=A0A3B1AJX9_9ZZZZ
MLKQMRHLIFISLLSTLLAACGGGGGGGTPAVDDNPGGEGGRSTVDTSAPTVSSTSPENSATAVARNSTFTAAFDEDIFAVTVDAASFTLEESGSNSISGSVSFDSASNVASFAPDNELAMLTAYTATLSTVITDLSGNALAEDYRWSFTTADGAWNNAELIETGTGGVINPQIAVDSSGKALAVWQQDDGDRTKIWANRFDGTSWGDSAEQIDTNGLGARDATNPQIAVDSSGKAFAVWEGQLGDFGTSGTLTTIWANYFDGTNWGTDERIEFDGIFGEIRIVATNPQIGVDNSGKAIAVWRGYSDGRYNIFASRFDGTSWVGAELIETGTGDASSPQIAFDSSGNALAVWEQVDDDSRRSIWANHFDGTSWVGADRIETSAENAYYPQIAVDSSGRALAVWQQSDGIRFNIWARHFDGTSWGSAELIEDDAGSASGPQIAVDSSGRALAVWRQSDGIRFNIWARHFDGTSWVGAELIETGTG